MKLTGYVEHIKFRNEENGYTVFDLNNEDGELTCVGNFAFINEGESLELEGDYTSHSSYGMQFKVTKHVVKELDDVVSIERYLGSGAIKGVGPALAGRIVKKFKGETFRIVEEEPERLSEVKGISMKMARQIGEQVEEKKDFRAAIMYLQKLGVSTTLAAKIYQHYGSKIYQVIETNPYQLADHVQGVGFKTADEIAERIGIHTDSDFRIYSGIFYTLSQCILDGHVYLPQSVLMTRASKLLGVEITNMEKHLMDLAMDKKIILKKEEWDVRVYPSQLYYMELNVAKMLHDLNVTDDIAEVHILHRIKQIEENTEQELDEKQQRAVTEAVRNGLLVVTGGPGTGKTTTINAMIKYFEAEGLNICLAAPTGRAAKRITETTNYEARTIHRMLEVNGNPEDESVNGFGRNMQNPLETDVIIIDEVSMVDIYLMHALLSAITPGTRLILVGDKNQLPSVGAGSVLKDIIASSRFKVVELTKIFRQASESDIVMNAHKINNGKEVIINNESKDFFFLRRNDGEVITDKIASLIQGTLSDYVEATPNDIQVLSPMHKGILGVDLLNKNLQKRLNPPSKNKPEKEHGDRIFRVGDKVMQTKNNYQLEWEVSTKFGLVTDKGLGIFNGEMGIVSDVNTYNNTVEVTYEEGKKVNYEAKMLEELEHAYAITIHKSQGSEYPAVIIPLLDVPRFLKNRNLLYTAVTRARRSVIIIGSEGTFKEMIDNINDQKRNTSLDEKIEEF